MRSRRNRCSPSVARPNIPPRSVSRIFLEPGPDTPARSSRVCVDLEYLQGRLLRRGGFDGVDRRPSHSQPVLSWPAAQIGDGGRRFIRVEPAKHRGEQLDLLGSSPRRGDRGGDTDEIGQEHGSGPESVEGLQLDSGIIEGAAHLLDGGAQVDRLRASTRAVFAIDPGHF